MIPAALFTRRGPDERQQRHIPPAFIRGAEDFLYRRDYRAGTIASPIERHQYHCGWSVEESDYRAMGGGGRPAPTEWR